MEKEVRKFRLSEETRVQNGVTLRRIEYLRTLVGADGEAIVSAGTKAGWLENESNLDQRDSCAVLGDAVVMGDARVWRDALVYGDAVVKDRAEVYGNAEVGGRALVAGYADITGNARVGGHTVVTGGSLDGDFQLSGEGVIIAMPS